MRRATMGPGGLGLGWKASDIPDLTGKVAVVTGGNGGLGFETSLELARHGATVIIGARDLDKADWARRRILAQVPSASLEIRALDLASLASVARFAAEVRAAHPRIDMLFNNAGVMGTKEGATVDGFETQFGTNYLGHFALTMRLLPALLAAPAPRVVNTTSTARFQFTGSSPLRPQRHGHYDPWEAYAISKRSHMQFALELNRRLADRGLAAFAADPGFSRTDLQPAAARNNRSFMSRFWQRLVGMVGQSAAAGALDQLRAGTDPSAKGGTMYAPRLIMRGAPVRRAVWFGQDKPADLAALWELSERETGLTLEAALRG